MSDQTLALALARRGFRDGERAVANLDALGGLSDDVVAQLVSVASPDTALSLLARIGEAWGEQRLTTWLDENPQARDWLLIVLGASEALGEFLVRHPELIRDLDNGTLSIMPLTLPEARTQMEAATTPDELRIAYRRALLHIAVRDLSGLAGFEQTAGELADLAVAVLGAALKIAQAEEPDADLCKLAIIAMGKTGGRELNYHSDVDVIFVHETVGDDDEGRGLQAATRLASATMRLCSLHTAEGAIWEVDANLRPEGNAGPLTRTPESHVAYYERWASTWEFQALLKARFAAGDETLGRRYLDAIAPLVWQASTRPDFVRDVRAMRRRVIENIAPGQRERQLKLGPGGLRDVEFAVQLLQLVHGRGDEEIHSSTTLTALRQLIAHGYVGRADGAAMEEAYIYLRELEHRIQLFRLHRLHVIPDDIEDLRRLGRSMGYRRDPVDNLTKDLKTHRRQVRRLHEKLFYRPLLEAVASLPTEGLRLTPQAAAARLEALGFADPQGALKHIESLTAGVSRRATIQKSLLPAMLEWFAESPDPDAGLLAFRKISDGLGDTHWYLRRLRDESAGAEQLARVVASSRYVTDLILRAPDSVALFGDAEALTPLNGDRLRTEMSKAESRHDEFNDAIRAIRRVRRRELSRVGIADVLERIDIDGVGQALSDITEATIEASLQAAIVEVEHERGPLQTRMGVVLMGRLGGHESGYGSDADVMFVHDPLPGADESEAASAATAVATSLRRALAAPSDDPPLEIDADLRPEGKNGPLVRSLSSYRAYYEKWSAVWEAQALLRARACIGDAQLGKSFEEMIDPLRWPGQGIDADEVREIRRIKARVDSERLPRGASAKTHLKLGRGGLADVEWTVQLLQMRFAFEVDGLRTTRTLPALFAAADAGLIPTGDAQILADAWRLVSRIRNAIVLLRGKAADSMVEQADERAGVAYLLGYGMEGGEPLMDDYLKATRHARRVVERVFWE